VPRGREETKLGVGVTLSAVVHLSAAAALILFARDTPPRTIQAPTYRVNIVAAPPGPRQVGVVTPPAATPEPQPATPTPPPPRAQTNPKEMPPPPMEKKVVPPRKTPPPAATPTPVPDKPVPTPKEVPRAGGGPTGGRGTDVATVRTEGIDFPYPGYLSNIVRQIALNFRPPNPNAPLSAEVTFLIRRDGTVSSFRFVTRSGDYAFDLEAQGAVEAAASQRAFGPLPEGFQNDVLPIVFSFDPRVLR
jgi:periplasmic protein TonB